MKSPRDITTRLDTAGRRALEAFERLAEAAAKASAKDSASETAISLNALVISTYRVLALAQGARYRCGLDQQRLEELCRQEESLAERLASADPVHTMEDIQRVLESVEPPADPP